MSEQFGPYRVVKKLGEGGMGAVYLAEDERLQRRVAVKLIGSDVATDPQRLARFKREARAAAALTHPNICTVHDVGETSEGTHFIAMEYVEGLSLRERVRREGGAFPIREALQIAAEVADALAEAHRRGVVHRDIKPDNIMLTTAGRVKVVDFGLARVDGSGDESEQTENTTAVLLTRPGVVMGTTHYMSPEQASGVEGLDGRSDIFSLGVVLYQMATGSVPFSGKSASEVIHKICVEEPPPLSATGKRIPADVERIVSKCLEKRRERRYQSAADLAVDLRHAFEMLTGAPEAAPTREHRRTRLLVLGAAVVAAAIVTGVVMISRMRSPSTPKPAPAASRAINSLAVLPLANASGDRAHDYVADAMTEELTSRLAAIQSLRIASRTSTNAYRNSNLPLTAVAQRLGVDALVEGAVARSGDRVQVNVRLIDGVTDRQLWSQTYVRSGGDLASLQSEVAGDVAGQIRATLTPAQRERVRRVPTRNPAAYEAYLRATYKASTALASEADGNDAIRYAEQAIALDPEFAEAYVVLARACNAILFGWNGGKEYDEKAYVAVEKAIALDPSLAEAYVVRGSLNYTKLHNFDIVRAIADYRQALAIDPNSALAHHHLGSDLTHSGFHEEGIAAFQTALRIDPHLQGAKFRLGRALWQANRFEEAVQQYRRENTGDFELAVALTFLGRNDEAWAVIRNREASGGTGERHSRTGADLAAARALLHALAGDAAKVRQLTEISFSGGSASPHFHHAAFVLAAAAVEIGDTREAVKWLRYAANNGMPNYPLFRNNPTMRKLHGNPEYEQFMSELLPRWERIAAAVRTPAR